MKTLFPKNHSMKASRITIHKFKEVIFKVIFELFLFDSPTEIITSFIQFVIVFIVFSSDEMSAAFESVSEVPVVMAKNRFFRR